MMRYTALMSAVGACVLIWHECGENPAFFCYRIGMGAFTGIPVARVAICADCEFHDEE